MSAHFDNTDCVKGVLLFEKHILLSKENKAQIVQSLGTGCVPNVNQKILFGAHLNSEWTPRDIIKTC
jgi:hypothetical protein